MKPIYLSILFIISLGLQAQSGKRMSRQEYIDQYKSEAIKEMHRSKIPASITLAQGILESGDGNSLLARRANNHFGIKCHSGWTGPTFTQDDDTKDECFRKYKHVLDSYRDHSDFLTGRSRYAFLFDLKPTDYVGWAKGLKKAGYATNPKYPQLLIRIIEDHRLYEYDKAPLAKKERTKKKNNNPAKSKREPVVRSNVPKSNTGRHFVKLHPNNIHYIVLKKGDTFEAIAEEFEMGIWQLTKYNDLDEEDALQAGSNLFLQPKRAKGKAKMHKVKKGESLWDISQEYGIKLKKLAKRNGITTNATLKAGQKLKLRK